MAILVAPSLGLPLIQRKISLSAVCFFCKSISFNDSDDVVDFSNLWTSSIVSLIDSRSISWSLLRPEIPHSHEFFIVLIADFIGFLLDSYSPKLVNNADLSSIYISV